MNLGITDPLACPPAKGARACSPRLTDQCRHPSALTAQTNLSTKNRAAIEEKYLEASGKLRQQQIAGQLEIYKQEEAAAGKNADAKLAVVQKETDYIGKQYGLQSDQYKAALARESCLAIRTATAT